jgi:hypothetical protein
MIHWQRKDKNEARRCYQKAVDWMQKHKPGDADLRRFGAEAAMLLGLKK